jgi:type IV pilus assembly protein PilF
MVPSSPPAARSASRSAGRLLALLLVAVSACTGKPANAPEGADPQRMSEAEYDVARDLWLRRHQPREALRHALRAIELDEDNADAAHLGALIYLQFCADPRTPGECRLAEAEKLARHAVGARPSFREAKNTLAVVLIHRRRYAEAVALLEPLSQDILYQTPENAWGNLGWAYLELGKLDLAVEALRRSVAAQPLFCVGKYRLGLAYERRGRHADAREAYSDALETDAPGCSALQEALAGRTRVLLKLGRLAEAEADLRRCAELSEATPTGKECRSMRTFLK